jgi:hypothetical protein
MEEELDRLKEFADKIEEYISSQKQNENREPTETRKKRAVLKNRSISKDHG